MGPSISMSNPSTDTVPAVKTNKNLGGTQNSIHDILGKSFYTPLPPLPTEIPIPKPSLQPVDDGCQNSYQSEGSLFSSSILVHRHPRINNMRKYSNQDHPFIRIIKSILNSEEKEVHKPLLEFEFSIPAAKKNWNVLEEFGSLDMMIRMSPLSPLSYGYEFRDPNILAPLLHEHRLWPKFKKILENGSNFPLVEIPEDLQKQDFDAILEYGNHKSATKNEDILYEHLYKELQKGWIIPLLPEDARKLPKALISPMGVVSQSTINELGEIVPSNRITHDLSFPGPASKMSVNSRTIMEELEPCYYGHMLLRTIHYIVACRRKFPSKPIVLQKIDFKSAYRRMHLNATTATQCLSQITVNKVKYVLLPLRLTFGGSACPSEWCIASEITTDLANRIVNHKNWDPRSLSAKLSQQVPKTKLLGNDIPFHGAKPTIVDTKIENFGKSDVYVDDICLVGVLKDEESECRLKNSILLALEIVGRPISKQEPLPRDELASISKLAAEAGLSETKCLLGWELDTRKLRIKLSEEKYSVWSSQIKDILTQKGRTTKQTLETILGRLNHAASIIPIARHFLSRINHTMSKMKKFKYYHLSYTVMKDLELWLKILAKTKLGISLNILIYRTPDKLYWSDACEFGIGGFSAHGKAWRWHIPEELQNRSHINLLEFMAEVAGIWSDILENKLHAEDCIIAFGDSTTAMGWIHKSRYKFENENDEYSEARLTVARKLADLVIEHDLKIYSQWFPGSQQLQSISTSARNNLVLLQRAAENSQAKATTSQYQRFNSTAWTKWKEFLRSIEIDQDLFLEHFNQPQRSQLITLFAQYLRSKSSSQGRISELAEGTIRNTISSVAQTFMENHSADPRLDANGKTAIGIRRILAGFKANDGNEKKQKALPVSVIKQIHKLYSSSKDPLTVASAQLVIGAFFFAMRSCEYSKTTSPTESKKTKIITIGNIRFFKNSTLIPHHHESLETADIVSITFVSQKNGERHQTISMHSSKDDTLCPVRVWASIVKRIRAYKGSSDSSQVNTYLSPQGKLLYVTSNQIRTKLRAAAATLGEAKLGFKISEIGCHSLRSGSAMAMYLAKVPITTIQLIGRWKSSAFMRYIREQVDCFTSNISEKILSVQSYYTIPEPYPASALPNQLPSTKNGHLEMVFQALVL